MLNSVMRRSAMLAFACALSISAHAMADGTKREIHIPSGDLAVALELLAKQSGTDLVYRPEQVQGFKTAGADGAMSAEEAVTKLLKGTPLTLSTDSTGAMLIALPTSDSHSPSQGEGRVELEEVVVTGSHIRGVEPAGSKLLTIDRRAIDASGYGRVEDVLATVSQNFAGFKESVLSSGIGIGNIAYGAEVQLRGLGVGTTLTLVNGQRQAMSGTQGAFTDVSSIQASAIERIEILPDGASALYGSDAIGGVVNIILRKDFEGFETTLRAGTAQGGARERQLAQLWGHKWSNGHVLLGYQYNDRDALPASERDYSATNGDLRSLGGNDFRVVGGNPGTLTLNGQTYAIPTGQNGTNLTQAQLVAGRNFAAQSLYTQMLPEQEMHSGFLDSALRIADDWELSFSGRYSKRTFTSMRPQAARTLNVPATNAFNRFGTAVRVAYDLSADLGPVTPTGNQVTSVVSTGVQGWLGHDWKVNVSGSYSRATDLNIVHNNPDFAALNAALASSDPATAFNPFGDGSNTSPMTLAPLRTAPVQRDRTSMSAVDAVADGPILDLPAGQVHLAFGGGYRKEDVWTFLTVAGASAAQDRHITAAFAELAVPLLPARDAGSRAGRLDLSLAGRHEQYSDVGSTTNPKVGLSWQPLDALKLRGTWGTSFRAPPFYNSNRADTGSSTLQVPDASGNLVDVLGLSGPAPNLRPEKADVWTAGFDLTPLQNFVASFTYFNIEYKDKIQYAGQLLDFLTQPAFYSSVTTLNPTQAQLDALCGPGGPYPIYPGAGECVGPVVAILDNSVRNLSTSKTQGVDAEAHYSLQTARGTWNFGLSGTYTFSFDKQLTPTAPVIDVVDTVSNPLKLRAAGTVGWSLGGWSTQATVNFTGAYRDRSSVPTRDVSSWTTVDLSTGYRTGAELSWLSDIDIHLTAVNVFDKSPPFVNQYSIGAGVLGYDSANASILGRMVSLQGTKKW